MSLHTKTILAVTICFPLLAACTTLRYPTPVTPVSPMGQALLSQATQKTCTAVLSYDKTTLYKLTNAMKTKEDAMKGMGDGPYKSRFKEELEALAGSVSAMEQGIKFIQRAKTGKLHVSVLGAAPERRDVFAFLIEQSLRKKGWLITDEKKAADYELVAVIKQDGVDVGSYNFLFFYFNYQLTGVTSIHLFAIDNKTNAVIYEDTVTENAYYKRNYLLGIGPINTTSLQQ